MLGQNSLVEQREDPTPNYLREVVVNMGQVDLVKEFQGRPCALAADGATRGLGSRQDDCGQGEIVGFRLRNSEARKSLEDQLEVDRQEREGRPMFTVVNDFMLALMPPQIYGSRGRGG